MRKIILLVIVFSILLNSVSAMAVDESNSKLLNKHEGSFPNLSNVILGMSKDDVLQSELPSSPEKGDGIICFRQGNQGRIISKTYLLDENNLTHELTYIYRYRGNKKENMALFKEILLQASEYLGAEYNVENYMSKSISRSDFEKLEESFFHVTAIWESVYFNSKIIMYDNSGVNFIYYSFALTDKGKELNKKVALLSGNDDGENEIAFRNIPWGSSILDVRKMLAEQQICKTNQRIKESTLLGEFNIKSFEGATYAYNSEDVVGYTITIYSIPDDITLAGHEIAYISVNALCDVLDGKISRNEEDSMFYEAYYSLSIADGDAVYDDLKTKLTALYGEPVISQDISDYINASYVDTADRVAWLGANNTGVYIEREWRQDGDKQSELSFYVYYGKHGMTDMFKLVDELAEQEKLDREKENIDGNSSNIDGL